MMHLSAGLLCTMYMKRVIVLPTSNDFFLSHTQLVEVLEVAASEMFCLTTPQLM